MDTLGAVFLILFLIIIVTSIVIFLKRLKEIGVNDFKYKLIFSTFCLISVVAILLTYYFLQKIILIDLLELKITINSYKNRISTILIVMILNIIANLYLSKIYLNTIYLKKLTNRDEIELIGKE